MEVKILDLEPQPAAAVDYRVPMEQMGQRMGEVFGEVIGSLTRQGVVAQGTAFSAYPKMKPDEAGDWEVISGFTVAGTVHPDGEVRPYEIQGGKVAVATHVGPYRTLGETYDKLVAWVDDHGYTANGPMWETYLTDPATEPDESKWRTEVYLPIVGA